MTDSALQAHAVVTLTKRKFRIIVAQVLLGRRKVT